MFKKLVRTLVIGYIFKRILKKIAPVIKEFVAKAYDALMD